MKSFLEKNYKILVIFFLALLFIFEITSAVKESQTIDEGTHLAAGYSYLMKNDFRMNTEHPPLIKELSALPLLLINKKIDSPFKYSSWQDYNQWKFAEDLIYYNKISADTIILLGRIPIMLLSLLLGFFIFKWTQQLFGTTAGLFSLLLYSFSPNIIAHGRYITTDLALAAFFFITIYYFSKFLKSGQGKFLLATAIFYGCALATKFSALILIPILFLLYAISHFYYHQKGVLYNLKKFFTTFFIIFGIGWLIIFTTYGFEIKKPIEDKNVQEQYTKLENILSHNLIEEQNDLVKKIIILTNPQNKTGQLIKNIAENVPLPAFTYLNGLTKLFFHNYHGHTSYLLGQYSEYGWWYYFPLAFLLKTPTTTIVLIFLLISGVIWFIFKNKYYKKSPLLLFKKIPLSLYCLVVPPLFYLLWSLASNINLGIRHILIIYPFIFVLLGILATIHFQKRRKIYYLFIAGLLIFYIISSLSVYPHYLAYFNEIVGGPANGPRYLVDSNIDWGQDVKKLKKYMVKHGIEHVCLSYFGKAKLEYYDIDYRYLPDNKNFQGLDSLDCVVAISVTVLYTQELDYSWLFNYEPDCKIGYSIYVYDFRKK